jgi:hypothetical protein
MLTSIQKSDKPWTDQRIIEQRSQSEGKKLIMSKAQIAQKFLRQVEVDRMAVQLTDHNCFFQ